MNCALVLMTLTLAPGGSPVVYTRYQPIQPVAHTTAQPCGQPQAGPSCPCSSESCSCCCRPTLLDRLRCFFASLRCRLCPPRCCCEPCPCNCNGGHRTIEPPAAPQPVPHKLPEKVQAEPDTVVPTVSYSEPAPVDPNQIKKEYIKKVGHDEDYHCVVGQLYHVHSDGGLWVVRYAAIDQEDRFGGSVVLAPAVSLKDVREGDLVRVHGEIINEGRASKHLGGPLYRALTVELLDRSNLAQNIPTYEGR
jgi:hypothetical protein